MSCFRVSLIVLFSLVQLVALVLAVVAIVLPIWLDPEDSQNPQEWAFIGKFENGTIVQVTHAGLWQVCFQPITVNNTRTELGDGQELVDITRQGFSQLNSQDCEGGKVLENFYKDDQNFGKNVFPELMVTRAFVIVFGFVGFLKLFGVGFAKLQEGRWIYPLILAILELVFAAIVSTMFVLIFKEASKQQNQQLEEKTVAGDFWGVSYWIFVSSATIALLANIGICL